MAYIRWNNSDWYVWAQWDNDTKDEVLMIWHQSDSEPQKFYPQQVRKMLKHEQFDAIRHFEPNVVQYLKQWGT